MRRITNLFLLGALTVSTASFVGCKSYDDDISNLQSQIDLNKKGLDELRNQIAQGKWVKSYTAIQNGFELALNDGTKLTITNGKDGAKGDKGDKGDTGAQGVKGDKGDRGTVATISEDGYWVFDGEKSEYMAIGMNGKDGKDGAPGLPGLPGKDGVDGKDGKDGAQGLPGLPGKDGVDGKDGKDGAQGLPGLPGKDGVDGKNAYSPKVGDDGFWYAYDDEKQEFVNTGYAANTSIYMVKDADRPVYMLHIWEKDAEGNLAEKEIALPAMHSLSSLDFFERSQVTLKYIKIAFTSDFTGEFNNKTYPEGSLQLLDSFDEKIKVQVNPVMSEWTDLSQFTIKLQDTKGECPFVVKSVKKDSTDAPLAFTRAGSWNEGIYEFTLRLNQEKKEADLEAYKNNFVAFALSTMNPDGNKVLSSYGLGVKVKEADNPTVICNTDDKDGLALNEAHDMMQYLEGDYLDFMVSVADGVQGITISDENHAIASSIAQKVQVTYKVLALNGEIKTFTKNLVFENNLTNSIYNYAIEAQSKEVTIPLDEAIQTMIKSNGSAEVAGFPEDLTSPMVQNVEDQWVVKVTMDAEQLTLLKDTVTLNVKNGATVVGKVFVPITKSIQAKNLVRKAAYFSGDNAKAYGKVEEGVVKYNLFDLFNTVDDKMNFHFKETVPEEAQPWLAEGVTDGSISYEATTDYTNTARDFEVEYWPYGNKKLAQKTQNIKFNLTMGSEVYDGIHPAAVVVNVPSDLYLSNGKRTTSVKLADLLKGWTDVKGGKIISDAGLHANVLKVTITSKGENAELYLKPVEVMIDKDNVATPINIELASLETVIQSEVAVEFEVKVEDIWGKGSDVTKSFTIKLKPDYQ